MMEAHWKIAKNECIRKYKCETIRYVGYRYSILGNRSADFNCHPLASPSCLLNLVLFVFYFNNLLRILVQNVGQRKNCNFSIPRVSSFSNTRT